MAKEKPKQPEAAEEQAEPKKKSPLMKYLIIAGILIAQTAAAYFIQKTIFFPDQHSDTEQVAEEEGGHGEEAGEEGGHGESAGGSIALLDEIIVNPAGTGGRRFLSTVVGLTLKDPKLEETVAAQMPIIRDAAITLLSSKSLDQLASIGYRDSLRSELVATINGLVKEEPVTGVVFSTYVLQ
ncbi:MAG: flagellar basal body-associated FliL family protein [Calditrichaeota bacterium]|nr:flagellar basal body-associated FliL family protein [Calditrichota bacterium]MCB9368816.1 flagellar basal body-associated FliL family protein [Calditrichota bacterium]